MNKTIHKSDSRGHASHGWLDTHHTFSFASYYNPERINFGALRVLNDDIVSGGMGFGEHPHDNMEIISIPLEGDLAHKDSMGTASTIKQGDVQVMSAGTGILHSEFNPNSDQKTNFLQIWVFPNKKDVRPRYGQQTFSKEDRKNKFQLIVSPESDQIDTWVHQDTWFHLADFEKDFSATYDLKGKNSGLYVFVLEGSVKIAGETLQKRDGLGLTDLKSVDLEASEDCNLLLMEVPLSW